MGSVYGCVFYQEFSDLGQRRKIVVLRFKSGDGAGKANSVA
jgi:hypothetical protein